MQIIRLLTQKRELYHPQIMTIPALEDLDYQVGMIGTWPVYDLYTICR